MFRLGALALISIILLLGMTVGYIAGARPDDDRGRALRSAQQRTAADFYQALGTLDERDGIDRLDAMLAPDFVEQRPELLQTADRAAFLRAAAQETRTFPDRQRIPVSISSDGSWLVVMVQTVDGAPGQFGWIALPETDSFQRELLDIRDGKIVKRVILEGAGSLLQSLEPIELEAADQGTQTIKVGQHDFAAHAVERTRFAAGTLIVVDLGRFAVNTPGIGRSLGEGDAMRLGAGQDVTIVNETAAPARILTLSTATLEVPNGDPDGNQAVEPAPGVRVSIVGQSRHFVLNPSCLVVSGGLATLAIGEKLPWHRVDGFEVVVPMSGELQASNRTFDFWRTDADRQWQDGLPFATLGPGVTLTAPPDSWTSYTATGRAPARFWVFAIDVSSGC